MMLSSSQPPRSLSLLLSTVITASFAAPLVPPTKRQETETWEDDDGGDIKGAEGPSNASFNLSKGAVIAIIVVAVVVAVVGITSAILFYIAKKRQWEVRKSIKRGARRAAESIKSPLTPRFPKTNDPRTARPQPNGARQQRPPTHPAHAKQSSHQSRRPADRPAVNGKKQTHDLEKGDVASHKHAAKSNSKAVDTGSLPWWKNIIPARRGGN